MPGFDLRRLSALFIASVLLTACSDDEKNDDGSEKEITFSEYVDKMNKRALKTN